MNNIKGLRFWCQKVIPLVYDDSLSYMELLSKVVKKLNELATNFNFLDDWKDAHEEDYEELANTVEGLVNSLTEIIVPWDSSVAYKIFTIVEYQGTNYIALQDVPVGVMITNTEYWTPANTVLEQINAIGVLVSRIEENWNVVPEFDDLKSTTTDRVIVLNDNGYYGSGCTVVYEKTDLPIPQHDNSAYQRLNGDWMMPVPSYDAVTPNAPMTEIGRVIASYVNVTSLVSSQDNDINPFRMDLPAGSMNGMDCSTFINLVIKGITYENSRYLATNPVMKFGSYIGNNMPRNPYSTRPGLTDLYMYKAAELALWYAEQNRLFYLDYSKEKPASQLAPGDLIFIDGEPNNRYLSIGHVAIVLNVFRESNRVMVAQCGGPGNNIAVRDTAPTYNAARLSILEITEDNNVCVYARPCYSVGNSSSHSIVYASRSRGAAQSPAAGGATNLNLIYLSENMKHDNLYTYVIEGTLPDYNTDKARLALYHNMPTGGSFNQDLTGIAEPGRIVVTLPAPENLNADSYIEVRARVSGAQTDVTQRSLQITSADIVEGAVPDAIGSGKSYDNAITVTDENASAYTANRAYVTEKGTLIISSIKITAAHNAAFTLGNIDPSILPYCAMDRIFVAQKNNTHESVGGMIVANTNSIKMGAMSAGDWTIQALF